GAIDLPVMHAHEDAVARQPNVALQAVDTVTEGSLIGGKCVLRLVLRGSTMRHDLRSGGHHRMLARPQPERCHQRRQKRTCCPPILERGGLGGGGLVIRRICTAAAVAALPLVSGLPSAHADAFFQGETNATAVHVTVTQEPASSLITASLFDDAVS